MQDQEVPENQKYKNQRLQQQHKINVNLICQTSLDSSMTQSLNEDEKIELVLALKSIHLQWLNIKKIQNLQVFSNLNILYLQHNRIKKIQNLQTLINLQYLALNDNFISKVTGLQTLKKLVGLNLNNNQIQELQYTSLPVKLQLVSFKNNPVCLDSGYKTNLLKHLKDVEMIDDTNVTPQDRFKALGIFPSHLVDYAAKMKQFRKKKQIQQQLKKQAQPNYLGQTVDQKQVLNELRCKTRIYLHENKQTFKEQVKQQNQDFAQKIQFSKVLRKINEQQQMKRMSKLSEITQQYEKQTNGSTVFTEEK